MGHLSGKRIVIAGGSGFLGLSMAEHFSKANAAVTILSRSKPRVNGRWSHRLWDGRKLGDWTEIVDGADAVVNLAGRSVNCIKTPDHQDEILRSRVESTRALGQAMRAVKSPPSVWVQMSTAHIYGDPPTAVCHEESAEGIGFAPTIGRAWETSFTENKLPNQRGVGKGSQGMSWIHENDLNSAFAKAIADESMNGVYIASSPNPVSQIEFMRTLRKVIGMPIGLPAFEWMVRIGAPLFFRTDPELALYGRYVVSKRLAEDGFVFLFPELEVALRDLYNR